MYGSDDDWRITEKEGGNKNNRNTKEQNQSLNNRINFTGNPNAYHAIQILSTIPSQVY